MPGTFRGESSVEGSWQPAKASADGMACGDASADCNATQSMPGTFGQACQSSGQTAGGSFGSTVLAIVPEGRNRDLGDAGEEK